MSITENQRYDENTELLEQEYCESYVVPEGEIRDFVNKRRLGEIDSLEAQMNVVVEVTSRLLEGCFRETDMQVLNKVASQRSNKQYRQIMRAVVSATKRGPKGIWAARKTAVRIMELAGR